VLIDGVDARNTYAFALESAPQWMDTPSRQTPSGQVLRRPGARVLDKPREQARSITLKGTILGTSADDARNKADALKLALSKNAGVQLTFDDEPTRYVTARCESFKVPPIGPSMIQPKLTVEATLTAHDPYAYDRDTQDVILWNEPGDALPAESFTRGGAANYFDQNGVLQSAALNVKRTAHYINGQRTALYERTTTNIVVSPRDLTNAAWVSGGGGITPLKNVTGIDGVANSASRITANGANGTIMQTVVLAASLRSQSVYVSRITGSGTLEMTTDGGATWTVITPAGGTLQRKSIPAQTVTNPQFGFRIATSGDAFGVDYVQNENTQDPSSPISGTRAADSGSGTWSLPTNVPLTLYLKYIEGTTDTANQRRFLRVGNSDTNSLILYRSGGAFRWRHNNGVTTSEGANTTLPAVGDTVEVRGVLLPNGACYVGISINGAAEVVGAASAALTFPAAWSAPTLSLPVNSNEIDALIVTKFLRGERTMAQARAATRPTGSLYTDTPTQMPLGTGITRPVVRIDGAAVNPVIALVGADGTTIATMNLTVTTVAGDVLLIDMDSRTITLNGVNRIDILTSGDFFSIDPADANFSGNGPSIGTSSGALSVIYRRAWR
jgi:predicted phage tail component-like protein